MKGKESGQGRKVEGERDGKVGKESEGWKEKRREGVNGEETEMGTYVVDFLLF